ncbi:MAG: MoaD/ThiS family protein [Armatimonadetes bacterium]|nr:MoaD/ThiS family protein [Armatimonadota bacterium]
MNSPTLQVTVLLFAYLREAAGVDQVSLQLPEGSRLSDVWPQLVRRYPRFEGMGHSLAWAVNHTYARPDQPLRNGDLVAALPPVSGGAYPCPGEERPLDG